MIPSFAPSYRSNSATAHPKVISNLALRHAGSQQATNLWNLRFVQLGAPVAATSSRSFRMLSLAMSKARCLPLLRIPIAQILFVRAKKQVLDIGTSAIRNITSGIQSVAAMTYAHAFRDCPSLKFPGKAMHQLVSSGPGHVPVAISIEIAREKEAPRILRNQFCLQPFTNAIRLFGSIAAGAGRAAVAAVKPAAFLQSFDKRIELVSAFQASTRNVGALVVHTSILTLRGTA